MLIRSSRALQSSKSVTYPYAVRSVPLSLLLVIAVGCVSGSNDAQEAPPVGVPELHHVMLNSVDPDAAIEWYLRLWPTAERTEVAGMPAVAAEMYLLFTRVSAPASGAFLPELGRPEEQSALWHIGAFVNTTNTDRQLSEIGVTHLPLMVGPDDEVGVWRSGGRALSASL